MSSFTCQTCLLTTDQIGKHLSQSRHKTVLYDPLQEVLECEDCGDSNVHLLQMLRYGLADLSLLCTPCYEKLGSEASAEYSLSNGSLFQKLPLYFKLRDIQCSACGAENRLLVANSGPKQVIMCHKCMADDTVIKPANSKFVTEGSPDFLYAFLGLKEFIPKANAKNSGRRKMGRKGGRERRLKPVDVEALKRKAHYESVKATSMALKTGKTMKAVGSSDTTPTISRLSTPAPVQSKPVSKPKAGKVPRVAKNVDLKTDKTRLKEPKSNQEAAAKKKAMKSNAYGANGSSSYDKAKEKGELSFGNVKVSNNKMKVSEDKPKEQNGNPKNSKETSTSARAKGSKDKLNNLNSKQKNPKSNDASKKSTTTSEPLRAPPKSSNSKEKGPSKANTKSSSSTQPLVPPTVSKAEKASEKRKTKVELDSPQIVLPPGIVKYEPSPKPKLTYDNMTEYLNEMCYNLFLEEKAGLRTSDNSFLTLKDFTLEWYAEQDRKHKMFKLNILMTPEFLDRFVSKKMQALKKVPFAAGQSLVLTLGDDIAWYGCIALSESRNAGTSKSKKPGKRGPGRKPARAPAGPKELELIVELYPWNTMPLPITVNVNHLKILPVSVPVSRVYTAMSRLLNPKFIDLLEGKKPIKQIVFKNYLKFTNDRFNESQKVAIQSVLNNTITVLQGPPGTGKTLTIYEIILQLLGNLNTYPILVVAASNIAIDNIAEKLLDSHKQSILRIVSLEKEPEYNREHPLASICLHHRVYDGLPLAAQETIREMRRPGSTVSQNQYKKLMTTMIDYSDKLIALARVIFTTTVVAGGNQLKLCPKIPVIIMDEATQSSEPTTLIPLSIPGVEKFVFVGDQRQLSSFSQVPNLSLSLFERIILNGTYKTPHMLDTQYRMHPAISEFPRNKFYEGKLKDGITAANRVMDGIPVNPVVFWDTAGSCPEHVVTSRFWEDAGRTYANRGEVSRLELVLAHLIYEKAISRADIGVITPYRGQRDLISAELVKNELINPEKDEIHIEIDRDDIYNESKPVTIHTVADIMIASVDAFQGREKNFLVMSCVRSNAEAKIGFLSDARRMNVALTRARYGLILVGDSKCLKGDDLWREYLDHLEERGSVMRKSSFSYDEIRGL